MGSSDSTPWIQPNDWTPGDLGSLEYFKTQVKYYCRTEINPMLQQDESLSTFVLHHSNVNCALYSYCAEQARRGYCITYCVTRRSSRTFTIRSITFSEIPNCADVFYVVMAPSAEFLREKMYDFKKTNERLKAFDDRLKDIIDKFKYMSVYVIPIRDKPMNKFPYHHDYIAHKNNQPISHVILKFKPNLVNPLENPDIKSFLAKLEDALKIPMRVVEDDKTKVHTIIRSETANQMLIASRVDPTK